MPPPVPATQTVFSEDELDLIEDILGSAARGDVVAFGTLIEATPNSSLPGVQQFKDSALGNVIIVGTGSDIIAGNKGADKMHGSQGGDFLLGNKGADLVSGGQGADFLYGGDGDDLVIGGKGNDLLSGDRGNDVLIGGDNNDIFEFNVLGRVLKKGGWGVDIVADFDASKDALALKNGDVSKVTMTDLGDDLAVFYDGVQIAVLKNVADVPADVADFFI